MTAPKSYEEVAALPEDVLRTLSTSGDAPARVHACWALAVRLGGASSDLVRDRVGAEPSAGVRRHLAVVLVGLGEIDLVIALAERDPDPYVRATAVACVARATPDAAARESWWLARLAADGTRALVETAIDAAAPSAAMANVLVARLSGADRGLRAAILRWLAANVPLVDVAALEPRAVAETDDELRAHATWIVAKRDPTVLARIDLATARAVLERVREEAVEHRWDEVAAFATRADADAGDRALAIDTVGLEGVPLTAALAHAVENRWSGLGALLTRCEQEGLDDERRAHLETLLERLHAALAWVPEDDFHRPNFEAEIEQLKRLLGR